MWNTGCSFFLFWMISTHENTIFETGTSHATDTSLSQVQAQILEKSKLQE